MGCVGSCTGAGSVESLGKAVGEEEAVEGEEPEQVPEQALLF